MRHIIASARMCRLNRERAFVGSFTDQHGFLLVVQSARAMRPRPSPYTRSCSPPTASWPRHGPTPSPARPPWGRNNRSDPARPKRSPHRPVTHAV